MMTDEKVLHNECSNQTYHSKQLYKPTISYIVIKRMFDFVSALLLGIILLLPMLIISCIIMVKDFGNPLYAQERVGLNGKKLKLYKFRSMKTGSDCLEKFLTDEQIEEYKKEYKLDDDPRLIGYKKKGDGTKCFGAKIRQTSIDEIPQILLNICILGNMSVVGPRPILESELKENYSPEQQQLLLSVKPGLTGYWQAYARNNVGYENGERQAMELHYVKNKSLLFDLKIILKTIEAVIFKVGAK